MKTYLIEYGDFNIDMKRFETVGVWRVKAYDYEHALDKFYSSNDDEGFTPIRIATAPKNRTTCPAWININ